MEEFIFSSKKEALKEAQKFSEKYFEVIYVIQSYEMYYIDVSGITEEWEVVIATFVFGEKITITNNGFSPQDRKNNNPEI